MKFWIEVDSDREQEVQELYQIWKELGMTSYKLNIDEAWQALSGSMDKLEQKGQQARKILADLDRYERKIQQYGPSNKDIR